MWLVGYNISSFYFSYIKCGKIIIPKRQNKKKGMIKTMKKTIVCAALALVMLCACASPAWAAGIDTAGGTGTSPVTLTVTPAVFSVTVPTDLPVTMTADGTIAEFLSTAYGDEYLDVVVGDSGMETTGTVINVLDADGNVVESYVYVLFGDMDMDAWVGYSDAYMAEYYENTFSGLDSVLIFMAGDVDCDAWCGYSDAYMMEYFENTFTGMPLQSEIGATNIDNYYELV